MQQDCNIIVNVGQLRREVIHRFLQIHQFENKSIDCHSDLFILRKVTLGSDVTTIRGSMLTLIVDFYPYSRTRKSKLYASSEVANDTGFAYCLRLDVYFIPTCVTQYFILMSTLALPSAVKKRALILFERTFVETCFFYIIKNKAQRHHVSKRITLRKHRSWEVCEVT
eukprot:g44075.t1